MLIFNSLLKQVSHLKLVKNQILKNQLRKKRKPNLKKLLKNFWMQKKKDKKLKIKLKKKHRSFLKIKKKSLKQLLKQEVGILNKFYNIKCFKHREMLRFSLLSKLVLPQNQDTNRIKILFWKNQKSRNKIPKFLKPRNEFDL